MQRVLWQQQAKEATSEVIVTGGQYLTGTLIIILTGLICNGDLPGDYKVWEGSGSYF